MQNDFKVSSCLLLILIGLAIYMLLNNKPSRSEDFEDLTMGNEPMGSESIINEMMPGVSEPVIPTGMLNEIVQSSEPVVQPAGSLFEQEMGSVGEQPKYTTSVDLTTPTVGADYQGFDETVMNTDGSSLNDAFNPPVPAGTKVDTVDFKKQNLEAYNAKDFLPKEVNDEWFETDFSLAKYQLNDDKLINTDRYVIGINTVGQSLKNATYDIRGTIPNPKFIVSPWNNSTYESDFNLKPLC